MSTNPFGPGPTVLPRRPVNVSRKGKQQQHHQREDPIWEARHIEWPLPSTLPSFDDDGGAGGVGSRTNQRSSNEDVHDDGVANNNGNGVDNGTLSSNDNSNADNAAGTGAGYLGGLMGKFISSQSQTEKETTQLLLQGKPLRAPRMHCTAASNGWITSLVEMGSGVGVGAGGAAIGTHGQLHSHGNVHASVASSSKIGGSSSSVAASASASNASSGTPSPAALNIRLISRWNVRRSTHQWVIIPPSQSPSSSTSNYNYTSSSSNRNSTNLYQSKKGRIIQHVFVDPTGNHSLFSSGNGDLYYFHSSFKSVRKLKGFGLNTDGSGSFRHGKPWREDNAEEHKKLRMGGGGSGSGVGGDSSGTNSHPAVSTAIRRSVQLGLTPGCNVTAVGWNVMGTEGATNKILLGTSFGEIYEFEIDASDHDDEDNRTNASLMATEEQGLPVLMVRLNESESGTGTGTGSGVVSGLHFSTNEHTGSTIMLAATSGTNKQTRLHSYQSGPINAVVNRDNHHPSHVIRRVFMADEAVARRSFMELPGSINYADLKVCKDGFALRTETGIYYGSIDDNSSDGHGHGAIVMPWIKGGNGITDAGMLPYESSNIPLSIAITPHHFVTLSETNEMRFINRVAKKTVQKERVDWIAMVSGSVGGGVVGGGAAIADDGIYGSHGELIMDPRRPDQVWLRKSRSLIHISSTREDRDVWKFSLEACLKGTIPRGGPSAPRTSMRRSRMHDDKYMDSEFEHAKSLCTNDIQKAAVTAARAEFHLNNGRVELAAKYMAQCPQTLMPFAETAIRLALPSLGIQDTNQQTQLFASSRYGSSSKGDFEKVRDVLKEGNAGLISYLSDKLRSANARNDGVACTMIGAWLVELHLHEREHQRKLDYAIETDTGGGGGGRNVHNIMMQQMLSSNAYNMDAKTILRILCSHDVAASECAAYAVSSGDIGTAINAALCIADYKSGALSALRVLSDAPVEQAEAYYYKHAFTLLSRSPKSTANAFLARFGDGLSATKLLPAFMRYEKKRKELKMTKGSKKDAEDISKAIDSIQISGSRALDENVEIRIDNEAMSRAQSFVDDSKASIMYFEGVITLGCKSTAVFNYLVSLYVLMEDETPLYNFLSAHINTTITAPGVLPKQRSPLDFPYVLRILLQSGRHFRSVIKMYMGLGNRQRAVELAINVDPTLAKELTRESVERDEKKRLWLMIARSATEEDVGGGEDVVSKVLSVLNECGPEILSIEDVLPFLPDVAQIDQFKDEICDALTSYSSRIEDYLKEMDDCDQSCNALREEIRKLSDYTTLMNKDAKCAFTEKPIVKESQPFYVFPSGFVFLESALKREVMPYLNQKQKDRLDVIEKELLEVKNQASSGLSGSDNQQSSGLVDPSYRIEELQCEIDGLIAAECPLTGSIMINSIDRGFGETKEDELYIASDDLLIEA